MSRIIISDKSGRLANRLSVFAHFIAFGAEHESEPALFWLDGHFSGGMTAKGTKETPVMEELDAILRSPQIGKVILIDDARMFGSDPSYPTIEELQEFVEARRKDLHITIADDCIFIFQ